MRLSSDWFQGAIVAGISVFVLMVGYSNLVINDAKRETCYEMRSDFKLWDEVDCRNYAD